MWIKSMQEHMNLIKYSLNSIEDNIVFWLDQ